MHRKIEVVPYNSDWPTMFKQEAEQITAIFGNEVISVQHIGSTSIPGIAAKPIIDILVEVQDIQRIDLFDAVMIKQGYLPKGDFGLAGRRFIIKGDELYRTHHIHMFATGHYRLEEHVIFRDYMIAHPKIAQKYGQLKLQLAKRYPYDSDGYMAGKEGLIQQINRKAWAWRAKQSKVAYVMNGG